MDDLPAKVKARDTNDYDVFGKRIPMREYTVFLGAHGPFVERVPLENFDESEIQRRIDTLRRHLQTGVR